MSLVFNIDRRLRSYFADPIAFRDLQARTDMLIAGLTALQFFLRTAWTEDLFLYVCRERRFEVGWWLLDNGYHFTPSATQPTDFQTCVITPNKDPHMVKDVDAVYSFTNQASKRVVVFSTATAPAAVLLRCGLCKWHISIPLTHVEPHILPACALNFIAYDTAFCLYPRATLERMDTTTFHQDGPSGASIVDYARLGIGYRDTYRSAIDPAARLEAMRWLGDECCWRIRLDTSALTVPKSGGSAALSITSWKILRNHTGMSISCEVVRHPAFRCIYVTADPITNMAVSFLTIVWGSMEPQRRWRSVHIFASV